MLDANAALILHSLSLALPVLQSLHPPTHTHASSLCSLEMNFSPGTAIQDAFSLCESEMRGNTRTQAEGLMNASGFYFAARGKCAPLCYAITRRRREALRKKTPPPHLSACSLGICAKCGPGAEMSPRLYFTARTDFASKCDLRLFLWEILFLLQIVNVTTTFIECECKFYKLFRFTSHTLYAA
jgi:hypothetical protein